MTAEVIYQGSLRTLATHLQSGSTIETDAPTDNNGQGERFSPTDLVATALASCMLTVMGIAAQAHGYHIEGTRCTVEKIMASNPRRISTIKIQVRFPETGLFDEKAKKILEHTAKTCPVHQSLHPDCVREIDFLWP